MIAKGALIGLQFEALFTDNLYFQLARHAIEKAMQMKQMFQEHGYEFYMDSPTNQQFVILPNEKMQRLEKYVQFTHWGPYDNHHTICRFVTSWATTDEDMNTLRDCL